MLRKLWVLWFWLGVVVFAGIFDGIHGCVSGSHTVGDIYSQPLRKEVTAEDYKRWQAEAARLAAQSPAPSPSPAPAPSPAPSPREQRIADAKRRVLEVFPSPSSITFIDADCVEKGSGGTDIRYCVIGHFDGQSKLGATDRWAFTVFFVDSENGYCQISSRRPAADGGEGYTGYFGTTNASQRAEADRKFHDRMGEMQRQGEEFDRLMERYRQQTPR